MRAGNGDFASVTEYVNCLYKGKNFPMTRKRLINLFLSLGHSSWREDL